MPEQPIAERPTPVGGVAAWTAETLDPGWRRDFTASEIDELAAAVETFRRSSPQLDLARLTLENFPLPTIGAEIAQLRTRLIDGQGVAAFEGFPVDRFEVQELRTVWWGLSLAIGSPVAQSFRGDVIGDVKDLGTGISGKTGRGYTSNAELNFHSDTSDISGLFFLKTARSGGVSSFASSTTVHDLLAERRPDLLSLLYQPLPYSWQGNEPSGSQPWYELPVFGRAGDDVACAYVRTNILLAHKNTGARELTTVEVEAVESLVETASAPGLSVEHTFSPGAMWFVNNHTVLHRRTGFEDWPEPERRRHLLRVWLSPPNSRRLPDSFAPFFGDVSAGAVRGGYESRSGDRLFQTV